MNEGRLGHSSLSRKICPLKQKANSHLHLPPHLLGPFQGHHSELQYLGQIVMGHCLKGHDGFFAATMCLSTKNSDADILQLTMCMA